MTANADLPLTGPVPRSRLRQVWRWVWRAGLALLLLVLSVFAAWVLSNLQDASPVPRPAVLALPAQQVAPEHNAFFVLMGLNAAADRDPAQVGRELWALDEVWSPRLMAAALSGAAEALGEQRDAEVGRITGKPVATANGGVFGCDSSIIDCVAQYRAQSAALVQQRQGMTTQGARCEALADRLTNDEKSQTATTLPLQFEEVLPAALYPGSNIGAHLRSANFCGQWLLASAALAQQQSNKDQALLQVTRSQRLQQALLTGSRSVIAQMVAVRSTRRHVAFVATLAAHNPAWSAELLPLMPALEAPEPAARRWVAVEAAMGQAALAAVRTDDEALSRPPKGQAPESALQAALAEAVERLMNWLAHHHIGWHPQRTAQLADRQWLAFWQPACPALWRHSAQPSRSMAIHPCATGVTRWDGWWLKWLGPTSATT
jgi:hypothetical protein